MIKMESPIIGLWVAVRVIAIIALVVTYMFFQDILALAVVVVGGWNIGAWLVGDFGDPV